MTHDSMAQPSTGRHQEERKGLGSNRNKRGCGKMGGIGDFTSISQYKTEMMLQEQDNKLYKLLNKN
jgi:hypothetical protein